MGDKKQTVLSVFVNIFWSASAGKDNNGEAAEEGFNNHYSQSFESVEKYKNGR